MRTLILFRGAPGCGKSTFIKNYGLKEYTLSPDDLRQICASLQLNVDGEYRISNDRSNEEMVWDLLFKILEYRMSRGELTVIDATNSKTKEMQRYKDLAEAYRYKLYIIDMTGVPLETCLAQNKQRDTFKWVPEDSIRNIYARFATQKIPSGYTIVEPNKESFEENILESPIDLSEYDKIVHIGDIHGCYSTLMQYFKDGIDPKTCYIFCGDYIDRGNENYETIKFIDSIKNLPNVCLLEGNHERWIYCYGADVIAKSSEFEDKTKPQLINGGFTQKEARQLYRKFRQMSHYTYNGYEVLACHAGIPHMNKNLVYMPTINLIKGVGKYAEYKDIAETWMQKTSQNQFLIHGHRNPDGAPIQIADRVFNLEGQVEFGGKLRIIELHKDLTWHTVELDNIQPIKEDDNTEHYVPETVHEVIEYLRNNDFVTEKQLGNNISSFNFTREAFYSANWNRQTVLARGLFINTKDEYIAARSYEKFFRVGETYATELSNLKMSMVFPVKAYVKENGFLAITSYIPEKDELLICSKSTNSGDYVQYISDQLDSYKDNLLDYFRKNFKAGKRTSLVFECIDIERDPHIIEYDHSTIILLDEIYNDVEFHKSSYDDLKLVAKEIGTPVKELAYTLKDWDSFRALINRCEDTDNEYMYNNRYIEGFVFEDANGFLVKQKSNYYNFWKKMRGVCDATLRSGHIMKTGMLSTSMENYFYGYCKNLYTKYRAESYDSSAKKVIYPFKTDIISIRKMYLDSLKKEV